MNVASGIVFIIAGLTAANPARGGYDQYGPYGQLDNNGNDFNFVPDGYGAVMPQNFGFNPLHNVFGNNPPQYPRAMPRFDQPIARNYQDSENKFRQVGDNLNNHIRQPVRPENAVPLIASHIVPLPVGRLVNHGFGDRQNSARGDRNLVSSTNSGFAGLNPDFLKPITSAFSAASASSGFSGSQNFDSHGSRNSGHFLPSASKILTQAASGFFGQSPDLFRPPTSGFLLPSASNIIAQATSGLSGSQDPNFRQPFNVIHQITSGLSAPFNSIAPPTSGSQASNSFKSPGSSSSSPASSSNAYQRTERSSPLASTSNNNGQFTTSQPITQVTQNSVAETTTTPPPSPSTGVAPTTTTTTTTTTTGSIQPASAPSVSSVVSENKGSGSITNGSSSDSTSASTSNTSVEGPTSGPTSRK